MTKFDDLIPESPLKQFTPYRSHLIRKHPMISDFFIITKDGFHIGTGSTLEEAKKAVDAVVGEGK